MILVKKGSRAADRSAFTLMEVLIVVAIIVILVGVTSVYMVRYLEEARKDAARVKATHIAQVLSIYQTQKGEFPNSLDVLLQPGDGGKPFLAPDELLDPWNRQFQ